MSRKSLAAVAGTVLLMVSAHGFAQEREARRITIDEGRSRFVVVTRRAGIAKSMAHDHLIEARPARIIARGVPGSVEGVDFQVRAETARLVVDDPASRAAMQGRLKALGVLDDDFTGLDADDRAKIRKNMLSEDQLFARRYPYVQARVLSSKRLERPAPGALAANAVLTIEVSIRGRTKRFSGVPARIEWDGDRVSAETVLNPRFDDFGFDAYSAMLGAVRNRDDFFIYVRITGSAAGK